MTEWLEESRQVGVPGKDVGRKRVIWVRVVYDTWVLSHLGQVGEARVWVCGVCVTEARRPLRQGLPADRNG
jgi:hypothetical protein